MTWAPARAAVFAVSSVDPSSMTTTSLANCLALRTTEPIVGPSLYAGIAATILDSTRVCRRTAGTGADASLSMLLSTLNLEVGQGRPCFPPSPHGEIPAIRVLPEFSEPG